MSTITPHYRTVQQLLQSQSFSIDEYQREFKWEKDHIDELLSDLYNKFISCYKTGDDTKKVSNYEEYFLGSIIVTKRNGKNYLIDGQQRVTSLTLLLIYLYREATKIDHPVVQTIAPLIYSDNLGEKQFNLDIPERLPVLEALFDNKSFNPDGKDESIQNMYARYADIKENDLIEDLEGSLPHFIYWLMTRVGLIEIATDNDNYAYTIFETMNDRGKPLSPVDMLKAYLLAPVENAEKRRNGNLEWKKQVFGLVSWGDSLEPERDSNFMKAWFRAQYAESIRERRAGASAKDWELIGSVFHRWVRENSTRLKLGKETENLAMINNELPFFAKAYLKILEASRKYTKGLESVFYNAQNNFTWQYTVLLASLISTDNDDTVQKKIAVTATYLDIWIMRRVVNYFRVGYSSTSYAMWRLCRDIRSKPLNELVETLSKKLAADDVTFKGCPSKGRNGLDELALNQFSRRYIFHILARVTAFTETGSGRSDSFDKYVDRKIKNPYDIEHIWADDFVSHQTLFSTEQKFYEWRNHIASLLLLPADVNRSLQDKSYADKLPHYAKQNFYAASLSSSVYVHQPQFIKFKDDNAFPFKSYNNYTKVEQQERRKLLAALVEKIWNSERIKEAAQ